MKDNEPDRPKLFVEEKDGVITIRTHPKRRVSVGAYLYGMQALPLGFIPAGQYIYRPAPAEVMEALEELETAEQVAKQTVAVAEQKRAVAEQKRAVAEQKIAASLAGASKGGKRGRDTKRDEAARRNESLLPAVEAERAKHPSHGRPTIAETLLSTHGRPFDTVDPADRKRAVVALTKRIERLEKKSLDR